MPVFTHMDEKGRVRMVDVTGKDSTVRVATAQAVIAMHQDTFAKIQSQTLKKGNVLETARIAGIMAAKRTSELIPMCHPLNISHVSVDFFPQADTNSIRIEATARISAKTGVEMEALTAAAVSALTIYDMCKSADREMTISDILLLEKSGGKSGSFKRKK